MPDAESTDRELSRYRVEAYLDTSIELIYARIVYFSAASDEYYSEAVSMHRIINL